MILTPTALANLDNELDRAGEIPERFFGTLSGTPREQERQLSLLYRQQARTCFPDHAGPADKALANEVAQKLNVLYQIAKQKIERGCYNDHRPLPPPYRPMTITVGKTDYHLTALLGEGAYATVHAVTPGRPLPGRAFLKVARLPQDNDLLGREYDALESIHIPCPDPASEQGFFAVQRAYIPRPISRFYVQGEKGEKHQAALYTVAPGRCFTAEALREEKFSGGLEPRHVWWIFRRLLLTLWLGHVKGYIHGAVTPDHLLLYPEEHGIVLLDWTNASRRNQEPIPAIAPAYKRFYPPEVWQKKPSTPQMDLFMAASTAIYLLGGDLDTGWIPHGIDSRIADALHCCLDTDPRKRPSDAEAFHQHFGGLLGVRKFAPLVVD